MTAAYDTDKFTAANHRYQADPRSMTDADIEQFEIVDKKLADKARAKRAGFVESETDDQKREMDSPASVRHVAHVFEILGPLVASFRFRIRENAARIEALEREIQDLKTNKSGAFSYRGVWTETEVYEANQGVTFDGSFWIAKIASRSTKPGEDAGGVWTMAVRRGKAGKDGKDFRDAR